MACSGESGELNREPILSQKRLSIAWIFKTRGCLARTNWNFSLGSWMHLDEAICHWATLLGNIISEASFQEIGRVIFFNSKELIDCCDLREEWARRALKEAICYRATSVRIMRASLHTQSFISEASFQDTDRVLSHVGQCEVATNAIIYPLPFSSCNLFPISLHAFDFSFFICLFIF